MAGKSELLRLVCWAVKKAVALMLKLLRMA